MKKILGTVSLIAMISVAPALASEPTPTRGNWSGATFGIFAGGAKPSFENNWNSGLSGGGIVDGKSAVNDLQDPGPFLGLRGGAFGQLGWIVYGAEVDVSYANIANSTYYRASDGQPTASERAGLNVEGLATLRGRLGLDLGRFQPFVTFGVSYIESEFTSSTSDTTPVHGKLSLSQMARVIGGGVEYKMADNVILGFTALHHSVGDNRFIGSLGDGDTTNSTINFRGLTTVDLSVKYKF